MKPAAARANQKGQASAASNKMPIHKARPSAGPVASDNDCISPAAKIGQCYAWTSQPMTAFNYDIVAELFAAGSDLALFPAEAQRVRRQPIGYGRFARAAYAIRFAIEELPAELLSETCLRVDKQVFNGDGIRQLYESESYPLTRRERFLENRTSNILPWKRRRQ